MQLRKLSCAGCGAVLDVSEASRYVTCSFCNASLELQHSESAWWTELRDGLEQQATQIRELQLDRELQACIEEFQRQRAGIVGDGMEPSLGLSRGAFALAVILLGVCCWLVWLAGDKTRQVQAIVIPPAQPARPELRPPRALIPRNAKEAADRMFSPEMSRQLKIRKKQQAEEAAGRLRLLAVASFVLPPLAALWAWHIKSNALAVEAIRRQYMSKRAAIEAEFARLGTAT